MAISRPSDETATASVTPAVLSTKPLSSQLKLRASSLRVELIAVLLERGSSERRLDREPRPTGSWRGTSTRPRVLRAGRSVSVQVGDDDRGVGSPGLPMHPAGEATEGGQPPSGRWAAARPERLRPWAATVIEAALGYRGPPEPGAGTGSGTGDTGVGGRPARASPIDGRRLGARGAAAGPARAGRAPRGSPLAVVSVDTGGLGPATGSAGLGLGALASVRSSSSSASRPIGTSMRR